MVVNSRGQIQGATLGNVVGAFSGALAIGVAGHLYQWLSGRPAVLVETPGLITLVPGSLGFRGLHALMQQESVVGINLMTDMLTTGAVSSVTAAASLTSPGRSRCTACSTRSRTP